MENHKSNLFLEIDTDTHNDKGNWHAFQNLSPASHTPKTISPTSSLSFDLDYDLQNCVGDPELMLLRKKELEELNLSVTKKCSNNRVGEKIGQGSSASVYEMSGNPNAYLKISDLPYDSYSLFNGNAINCDVLERKFDISIKEIENSLIYSRLVYAFPANIMKVESAERCQKNYGHSSFMANQFVLEKIVGHALDDVIGTMSEQELICCVLQLVYILTYANINGYFHNDLTCNNIMIYYGENSLVLNRLNLADNLISLHFNTNSTMSNLPIVKLIDFSYSTHINLNTNPTMINKVVIGEPQQIIKMIKNKLERLSPLPSTATSRLFQTIHTLFDRLNSGNDFLQFRYHELNNKTSSVGFRTLGDDEIKEMAITSEFANNTLLGCFSELEPLVNNANYGIIINILRKDLIKKLQFQKQAMRKSSAISSIPQVPSRLPDIHKYLKYNTEISKLLKDVYV
jgi:hypothetical protein